MIVIPAIDIRQKKSVMLARGLPEGETVYSDDPVDTAKTFLKSGAERLHIVDLDAALSSDNPQINRDVILSIRKAAPDIPIEIGGGIRTAEKSKEISAAGFDYIIMGTAVVRNSDEFRRAARACPGKIMAACDVNSEGKIMISGWREQTDMGIEELLKICSDVGDIKKTIIVTDVSSDGMLTGINEEFYLKLGLLFVKYGFKLIASGGVATLEDIKKLKSVDDALMSRSLGSENVIEGVIVGKALYEKKFTLQEAIALSAACL